MGNGSAVRGARGSGSAVSRRRFVGGAAALAAAGTAGGAACGAPGGEANPAGTAGTLPKNATLEAWFHSDNRYPWQQRALEDYNKAKGASLAVNWTKISSDTREVANKLIVSLAAGSGAPDMCDIEISRMGMLIKTAPPFAPFNDALRGKQGDFFLPSFVDPWSDQGAWYGLGNELNAVLLAYRTDLFERAGVRGPLKTWDDVVDAGKRLAGAGVTNGIFFVANGTTGATHVLSITAGGGYTDKSGKLTIPHEGNARAIQYLSDLVVKHKAAAFDPSTDDRMAAANAGLVGGDLGPSWRVASLDYKNKAADSKGKWAIQHLPQWAGTGKTTTTWGGTGMTVLKDSKNKEIAQDFLVWEHVTPTAILHDYDLRQVYPVNKKAFDDPRLNQPVEWFNNQKVGAVIKEAADAMLPFFQGKWWPEISDGAGKHVTAALRGEKPAKQALDEALTDAKAAIEAAGGRVEADGTIR